MATEWQHLMLRPTCYTSSDPTAAGSPWCLSYQPPAACYSHSGGAGWSFGGPPSRDAGAAETASFQGPETQDMPWIPTERKTDSNYPNHHPVTFQRPETKSHFIYGYRSKTLPIWYWRCWLVHPSLDRWKHKNESNRSKYCTCLQIAT